MTLSRILYECLNCDSLVGICIAIPALYVFVIPSYLIPSLLDIISNLVVYCIGILILSKIDNIILEYIQSIDTYIDTD
jgi:hypothetical protein